jgi:hypothetical protein
VEEPTIAVELGPISNLMVVQSPRVAEAVRELLAEVRIADHPFNDRLEVASAFSFDVDNLLTPFGGPTLIVTARKTTCLDTATPGTCWTTTPERRSPCWIGQGIL